MSAHWDDARGMLLCHDGEPCEFDDGCVQVGIDCGCTRIGAKSLPDPAPDRTPDREQVEALTRAAGEHVGGQAPGQANRRAAVSALKAALLATMDALDSAREEIQGQGQHIADSIGRCSQCDHDHADALAAATSALKYERDVWGVRQDEYDAAISEASALTSALKVAEDVVEADVAYDKAEAEHVKHPMRAVSTTRWVNAVSARAAALARHDAKEAGDGR